MRIGKSSSLLGFVLVAFLAAVVAVPADMMGYANQTSMKDVPATAAPAEISSLIRPAVIQSDSVQAVAPARMISASPVVPQPVDVVPTLTEVAGIDLAEVADEISVAAPYTVAAEDAATARVGGRAVNARAEPTTSSQRLFVLQAGTEVSVLSTSQNWVLVDNDGQVGWVYSQFLEGDGDAVLPRTDFASSKTEAPDALSSQSSRITLSADVAARAGPSLLAPALFSLAGGQRVEVVERRGRWMRVAMKGGVSGWIRADAL